MYCVLILPCCGTCHPLPWEAFRGVSGFFHPTTCSRLCYEIQKLALLLSHSAGVLFTTFLAGTSQVSILLLFSLLHLCKPNSELSFFLEVREFTKVKTTAPSPIPRNVSCFLRDRIIDWQKCRLRLLGSALFSHSWGEGFLK